MDKIRILIADDQALMRDGLKTILDLEKDLEVVGVAGNGEEAWEKTKALNPDVVLMDIRMPVMNGVEGTRRIRNEVSGVKVIILTTFDDDVYIFDALKAGANGYLLKDLPSEELVRAIRTVYRGGALIPPDIAAKVVAEFARMGENNGAEPSGHTGQETPAGHGMVENLTGRELEIIRLVAGGKSNKEIARNLYITEGTVKNHISNILGKLELRDRTQIAIYAVQKHLIR